MVEINRDPRTNQIKEIKATKEMDCVAKLIQKNFCPLNWMKDRISRLVWKTLSFLNLKNEKGIEEFVDEKWEIEVACRDTSVTMWVYSALKKFLANYGLDKEEEKEKIIQQARARGLVFTTRRISDYAGGPTEWTVLILKKVR